MAFNLSIFKHSKHTFEGKKEGEDVEIFVYSHWITIVLKLLFYIAIAFIPLLAILVFLNPIIDNHLLGLSLFALFGYYMIIWSLCSYEVMIYLLDNWIVTNERIIDIDQKGFFARSVAEISLERVQDISVSTRGLIQTVLDFGDLEIQSAGAVVKFKFKQVPHPELIKDRIMKLVEAAKKENKYSQEV